ncbi:UNVERIFIED_CONTAM: hypothetical protein K2H54_075044 [Gekko kuhli]
MVQSSPLLCHSVEGALFRDGVPEFSACDRAGSSTKMATVTHTYFVEGQTYSVPLIQPDLRREEAIHQIADALQYLQTISADIFNRYGLAALAGAAGCEERLESREPGSLRWPDVSE